LDAFGEENDRAVQKEAATRCRGWRKKTLVSEKTPRSKTLLGPLSSRVSSALAGAGEAGISLI